MYGFVVCGWFIGKEEVSKRFMERYEVELYWMNYSRNAGDSPLYGKRCAVDPATGAVYISEADRKLVQDAYNQFDAMVIATSNISYLCCIGGDVPYCNAESDVDEDSDS
jgi:hypothetical protein